MKLALSALILASVAAANAATLFDNGPYVTSGNLSILTSPDTTFGIGSSAAGGFFIADNFTLTSASILSSLTVYGYQTGSTTTSTFTGGNYAIYSAAPTNLTTGLIAGGLSTPASITTAFTGNYRVLSTATTGTTRPIMSITMDLGGLNLAAGSYYVAYGLTGTGASGPFTPPTTSTTGNNALQYNGTSFIAVTDGGSLRALDTPFVISGQPVPEPTTMVALGLGAVAMLRRRKRA